MIILGILLVVLFFRVFGLLLRLSWRITCGIICGVGAIVLAVIALPYLGLFLLPVIAGGIVLAFVLSLAFKGNRA